MTRLARRKDPKTSKDAGRAAECDSRTHRLVMAAMQCERPTDKTDEDLCWMIMTPQRPTDQRIRCARKELADAGKIVCAGTATLASGRKGRTWRLA